VARGTMAAVRGYDVESLLGQLKVPTLVIAPARSTLQPLAGQVAIYERIPDGHIAVIDGPGHEVYLDRPADCTAALRRFLSSG
jgi:pimeloyl-ACP methyl ester carboxylesterase